MCSPSNHQFAPHYSGTLRGVKVIRPFTPLPLPCSPPGRAGHNIFRRHSPAVCPSDRQQVRCYKVCSILGRPMTTGSHGGLGCRGEAECVRAPGCFADLNPLYLVYFCDDIGKYLIFCQSMTITACVRETGLCLQQFPDQRERPVPPHTGQPC